MQLHTNRRLRAGFRVPVTPERTIYNFPTTTHQIIYGHFTKIERERERETGKRTRQWESIEDKAMGGALYPSDIGLLHHYYTRMANPNGRQHADAAVVLSCYCWYGGGYRTQCCGVIVVMVAVSRDGGRHMLWSP